MLSHFFFIAQCNIQQADGKRKNLAKEEEGSIAPLPLFSHGLKLSTHAHTPRCFLFRPPELTFDAVPAVVVHILPWKKVTNYIIIQQHRLSSTRIDLQVSNLWKVFFAASFFLLVVFGLCSISDWMLLSFFPLSFLFLSPCLFVENKGGGEEKRANIAHACNQRLSIENWPYDSCK